MAWLSGLLEADDAVDLGWVGFRFDLYIRTIALFAGGDVRSEASEPLCRRYGVFGQKGGTYCRYR